LELSNGYFGHLTVKWADFSEGVFLKVLGALFHKIKRHPLFRSNHFLRAFVLFVCALVTKFLKIILARRFRNVLTMQPTNQKILPCSAQEKVRKDQRTMKIGTTIRGYRLQKGLSQGDIEKRTGLLRCYLSRVENGHTVPSLDTLAKIAGALELPLAQLFAEDTLGRQLQSQKLSDDELRFLTQIRRYSTNLNDSDRKLLLAMVKKFATTAAR
jgi:transcriptional regulator with XRE-family HTH domain